MPGKHKDQTISFRPTEWERTLIEERAYLSGIYKKDFISRSCIYSNIVVTGTAENIMRIIDEMQIMESVMEDIAGQIKFGNITLSKESFREMSEEYLALAITIVDILKGASYLYGERKSDANIDWKKQIQEKFNEEK